MSIKARPWEGGGAGGTVPDASETVKGIIRIATSAEATTGTDDTIAMTPLKTQERISAALVGGVKYKTTFNATAGTPSIANALKGEMYVIDTAGTIYGQTWAVGDHLIVNEDMGGSVTNSKIDKVDNTDSVTSVNGSTGAVVLSGDDLAADHTASNYTAANANIDGHFSGVDAALGTKLSDITGQSLDDLSDVSYTAGAGIDNYVLTYDNSTTSWGAEAVPSAPVTSVNSNTGAVVISGNDVVADHTASNYTAPNPQVDGHFSGVDTALGNKQPLDAGLTSISGLTTSADKMIYTTASDTYAVTDLTSAGRALLDDADASAQRTTLGLGTAATSASSDFLASTAGLNNLSDVTISSVSNGQVISYNSTSGEWENSTPASGGATDLNGLSDVTITSAASGNILQYNGSGQFVNVAKSTINVSAFNDDGTYLNDVVDDTTPQLGGPLDTNGQSITSAASADVTIDPNGTGDIVVGADVLPAADATHTLGAEDNRFVTLHSELNGAVQFKARNESGGALTKGQAVYISGVSGTVPLVSLARANSASTMPAFGLLASDVSNNADVQVITFGNLTDYNTTTYSLSAGDTVFVSAATAGALTNTAPTGEANLIQNIGRVVRADASAGIVKVGGAGRSNATPNLDNNKIFVGNASNQAVSTALSAIDVSAFNDDGTYQPLDAGLTSISGLTTSADKMIYTTASDTYAVADLTTAGRALLDDADASAQRTTLGLGTAATSASSDFLASTAGLNDLSDVSYTAGAGIDNYVLTYDHSTTSWGAEAAAGGGGGGFTYSAVSSATTAQAQYHYSVTGTTTITLPAASGITAGQEVRIKNMGSNTVTISRSSTDTIDGETSIALGVQYQSLSFISNGSNGWEII